MSRTGKMATAQSAPSRLWRAKDKAQAKATKELFRTPWDVWASFIQTYPEFVNGAVLDPCAGDATFHWLLTTSGNLSNHKIYDIRPVELQTWRERGLYRVLDAEVGDFLDAKQDRWYDNAVTNPPFSLACEFVEKMLTWVRPGGHVAVLSAVNWLGGQDRATWFQTMPFYELVVIPWRPTFTHERAATAELPFEPFRPFTFAYNFGLFCFKKGYKGKPSISFLPELHPKWPAP